MSDLTNKWLMEADRDLITCQGECAIYRAALTDIARLDVPEYELHEYREETSIRRARQALTQAETTRDGE